MEAQREVGAATGHGPRSQLRGAVAAQLGCCGRAGGMPPSGEVGLLYPIRRAEQALQDMRMLSAHSTSSLYPICQEEQKQRSRDAVGEQACCLPPICQFQPVSLPLSQLCMCVFCLLTCGICKLPVTTRLPCMHQPLQGVSSKRLDIHACLPLPALGWRESTHIL